MATDEDVPNSFDKKLDQRKAKSNPLSTVPTTAAQPHGKIPNTPLAASTISFILGSVFTIGLFTFLHGGFGHWWSTYQLGFFVASWAAFHWGEFAVTAGWNLEKCSVDCECTLPTYMLIAEASSVPIGEWQPLSHCTQRRCY
jgi:protein-S-isoprenylcysteine O-methyltransferase